MTRCEVIADVVDDHRIFAVSHVDARVQPPEVCWSVSPLIADNAVERFGRNQKDMYKLCGCPPFVQMETVLDVLRSEDKQCVSLVVEEVLLEVDAARVHAFLELGEIREDLIVHYGSRDICDGHDFFKGV